MGQLAGTTFGLGTQTPYLPLGLSPYVGQPFGQLPISSPYLQALSPQLIGGYGLGGVQPFQQALQLLHLVSQQIQQVQILQQQQLVSIQQLLQIVPAQLQQLQQLIQIIPQQIQLGQQQWSGLGQGLAGGYGFGLVPQPFVGQASSLVM